MYRLHVGVHSTCFVDEMNAFEIENASVLALNISGDNTNQFASHSSSIQLCYIFSYVLQMHCMYSPLYGLFTNHLPSPLVQRTVMICLKLGVMYPTMCL